VSVVSIVRLEDDDVETAVRKAVALTHALDSVQWKGSMVLIKPNVVKPVQSGSGIVTDARLIEAVTRLVLERNPRSVVIGEGSSVGYDFPDRMDSMDCMEMAGVLEVARKCGVEVVDLNRDEQVEVKVSDAFVMDTFAIAKTAWQADVIISLPVIKTHVRTGITCGLKNMKGVLPGVEKKRTHQRGLDRAIVDLNRVAKPEVTVVDGITGAQGTNTDEADRVPLNLVLAGNDVVAVDAVCATVAGFDSKAILHVQLAADANLGTADLNLIEVCGQEIEAVRHPFIPYLQAAQYLYGDANIVEKDACTGCMGELVSTFVYLKRAGFSDRLADLTLIMGNPDNLPSLHETPVVVGRCAQKYRCLGVFVPGCPPHGRKITDGVCEALEIDQETVHRSIVELHNL
jgi:uncharacterized protein (DUF362 family)